MPKVQSTLRRGSAEKFVNAPVDKEPLGIITNFYQGYLAFEKIVISFTVPT
jgi:hypothetical protein